VNRVLLPRGWEELHGSDGAIEAGVAIQNTMVGIGNGGIVSAVEQRTEDPWVRHP
jgi:hypothetical protein